MSLTGSSNKPIEIFYSYSHKDEKLRDKLETHLSLLKQQGVLINWHDRKISAGEEWAMAIDSHLNTADIILLLVSPDFLASSYCYSIEMKRAMARHEKGEAIVIPVILRPVHWKDASFGKLQALPTEARPITGRFWHNQDEAFYNVAEGIREAIKKLTLQHIDPMNNEIEALRNALFNSSTFQEIRPPVIAVVGVTGVGKSSLINALASDELVAVSAFASTDAVLAIRFHSGLIIYDMLGISGLNEERENINRAYLGLRQVGDTKDRLLRLPIIDLGGNQSNQGATKKYEEIHKPDLYIFVLAGSRIVRSDLQFYHELAELGKPVIVVINQIDIIDPEHIEILQTLVWEKLNQHAIALSAKTGQNIQELIETIKANLPFECQEALEKEINKVG